MGYYPRSDGILTVIDLMGKSCYLTDTTCYWPVGIQAVSWRLKLATCRKQPVAWRDTTCDLTDTTRDFTRYDPWPDGISPVTSRNLTGYNPWPDGIQLLTCRDTTADLPRYNPWPSSQVPNAHTNWPWRIIRLMINAPEILLISAAFFMLFICMAKRSDKHLFHYLNL